MRGSHGPLVQWVVFWAIVGDVAGQRVHVVTSFEPVDVDSAALLSGFCPGGKFMTDPSPGPEGTIIRRCMNCAVGKYQDEHSQTTCKNCRTTFQSYIEGPAGLPQCMSSHCTWGSYGKKNRHCGTQYTPECAVTCTKCPHGYYQNEKYKNACKTCATGQSSATLSGAVTCHSALSSGNHPGPYFVEPQPTFSPTMQPTVINVTPTLTINWHGAPSRLTKSGKICHMQATWDIITNDECATPPCTFLGTACLDDGTEEQNTKTQSCDVSSTSATTVCTIPGASVFDHHENDISEKLTTSYELFIKSEPKSLPKFVQASTPAIDFNLRSEHLITYGAVDAAGNAADPTYFVLVLRDHVKPQFSFGVQEDTSYRQVSAGGSTFNFTRFQYVERPTATDNIDGDVSETITLQVTGPNGDINSHGVIDSMQLGTHQISYWAHDYASIFGDSSRDNEQFVTISMDVAATEKPRVFCKTAAVHSSEIQCTTQGTCSDTSTCNTVKTQVACDGQFVDHGAICLDAYDSYDGVDVDPTSVAPTVEYFRTGNTQFVTYTCTNSHGYHSNDTRVVELMQCDDTGAVVKQTVSEAPTILRGALRR